MSKPQVTITLGRSGRKVVKRQTTTFDGDRANAHQPLSGSKRSLRERLDSSNADTSMSSINKRSRRKASKQTSASNAVEGVGRNDLRLKLMRKRLSRQIQQEVEERKKMERSQRVTRTVQSFEDQGPDRGNLRQISPKRRADGLLMMDPMRSYSSWASEVNPESSNRRRTSVPMNIDEMRMMSLARSNYGSRDGRLVSGNAPEPSRSNRPTTITMGGTLDAEKRVSELLPLSGGGSRSSYMGEPPQTVTSLLHSLGLGKYAVQFQAEEVDMTVLKQMGDNDLKELGIPMGPRKKILLAVLPPPKKREFVATTY